MPESRLWRLSSVLCFNCRCCVLTGFIGNRVGWKCPRMFICQSCAKRLPKKSGLLTANNKGTPANRLERCDRVIYMDYYLFLCCRRVIRRALLYSPFWYVRGRQRADKLPFYFKFSADNRTDNDGLASDKSAEIWFFMVHNDRDTAELVRRLRQEAWTQWFRPLVF